MFTFGMVVMLTALMLSLVLAQSPHHHRSKDKPSIFRHDPVNNRLLIHPRLVGGRLIRLTLKQNQQIVLSDDLSAISTETVYGLDLNQLAKGKYVIELLTVEQQIWEEITVE